MFQLQESDYSSDEEKLHTESTDSQQEVIAKPEKKTKETKALKSFRQNRKTVTPLEELRMKTHLSFNSTKFAEIEKEFKQLKTRLKDENPEQSNETVEQLAIEAIEKRPDIQARLLQGRVVAELDGGSEPVKEQPVAQPSQQPVVVQKKTEPARPQQTTVVHRHEFAPIAFNHQDGQSQRQPMMDNQRYYYSPTYNNQQSFNPVAQLPRIALAVIAGLICGGVSFGASFAAVLLLSRLARIYIFTTPALTLSAGIGAVSACSTSVVTFGGQLLLSKKRSNSSSNNGEQTRLLSKQEDSTTPPSEVKENATEKQTIEYNSDDELPDEFSDHSDNRSVASSHFSGQQWRP